MTALSPRQREIVILIGAGWSSKQICVELNLAHSTVMNYTKPMYTKLDVPNGPAAVARALDLGLVTGAEIESRRLSRNGY